jgi:SAM-dependent methyltransferase
VTFTGVDLSEGMLAIAIAIAIAIARDRARRLGHPVTLREGDAEALPFAEASFDTVLCTFGLCAIPDPAAAVGEMVRVLRPGGRGDPGRPRRLVFPGRAGPAAAGRAGERPLAGEHFRRRPLELVEALGLPVQRRERFKLGLVAGKIS